MTGAKRHNYLPYSTLKIFDFISFHFTLVCFISFHFNFILLAAFTTTLRAFGFHFIV